MSCFHPITCWRQENETRLIFSENPKYDKIKTEKLKVPCGKCIGCLLDRSSDWSVRSWCETQKYTQDNCCFITLTYNDDNLPEGGYLNIEDTQKFWKLLRYHHPECKIKYMGCGEYGPKTFRCHFHFCVWGYKPKDLEFYKFNRRGDKLYKSKELYHKDKNGNDCGIWGKGFVIVGNLTYRSACYVARYCSKKLFKKKAWNEKIAVKPECTLCSKGIGLEYWNKNKDRILNNHGIHIKVDKTVTNHRIPKYYMKKFKEENGCEYEWYTYQQQEKFREEWEKTLKETSLTEEEYREQLEKELLEKSDQLLKRTNFI